MERLSRKPFQGVTNIVRFNWHFYVIAFSLLVGLLLLQPFLPATLSLISVIIVVLSLLAIMISLGVSYYIYDLSDLYTLNWLNDYTVNPFTQLVTINAGFDETSALLEEKYPHSTLLVFDFYDPAKHTEVSIERARKAYPAFNGTKTINTNTVPLEENSADTIFLILAAHEIRDEKERIIFFKQLQKALTANGKIIVTEHLRDLPNFFAYNFGFFHFHSKATWLMTFAESNLNLEKEIKITPFISTFILTNHGAAS